MRSRLGCGEAPTEEDFDDSIFWQPFTDPQTEQETALSPASASARGLPAFVGIGYGSLVKDWPWCPRWYWAFSTATLDGEPTFTALQRAYLYREKGALHALIQPPYTPALIEGLDMLTRLEQEREHLRAEADARKGAATE